MNSHRDRAVGLLQHYITRLMTAAGLKPDSDTHVELEELVDAIIDAARAPESAHTRATVDWSEKREKSSHGD